MAKRETKPERLDRELGELLQELRVLLPGVQVLLAFLLTVPFASRFTGLSEAERALYLTSLMCAAVASALLIAPSAFHRLLFREHEKEWMIKVSNGVAIAGTVFLATSICTALFLVIEFIYGSKLAAVVAASTGALYLTAWYIVPLARRTSN